MFLAKMIILGLKKCLYWLRCDMKRIDGSENLIAPKQKEKFFSIYSEQVSLYSDHCFCTLKRKGWIESKGGWSVSWRDWAMNSKCCTSSRSSWLREQKRRLYSEIVMLYIEQEMLYNEREVIASKQLDSDQ